MKKTIIWTFVVLGVGLLTYVSYRLSAIVVFSGAFEKYYSTQDLIDNYNERRTEIEEVRNYINKIVPSNKSVDIEFDDRNTLGIFHVAVDGNFETNWNVETNSGKADTLLQKLGWTNETLELLKEKLDYANCISVESGEPCKIGFQRSGMGKYFYNLFEEPIADSLENSFNDSCRYILYNDKVVLEYGGGAIGPQCFPSFKRGRQ